MRFLKSVSILLVLLMVLCTCTVASATPIKEEDKNKTIPFPIPLGLIDMKVGETVKVPLTPISEDKNVKLSYDKKLIEVQKSKTNGHRVLKVTALKPGLGVLRLKVMDKDCSVSEMFYLILIR